VLLLEDVTVETGGRRVLDHVDLAVRRGERFGVVAADPAARAAIVGLLAGHTAPTAGRVRVDGLDPSRSGPERASRVRLLRLHRRDVIPIGRDGSEPAVDVWLLDVHHDAVEAVPELLADLARLPAPHPPTVLLVTADERLATGVCDRVAVVVAGAATEVPVTSRRTTSLPPTTTTTRSAS
jgi:ABC-type dipeptide/oligopeptide/nickel transport system ATPase subunit